MTRQRRRYPNVSSFVDRHGKERWRYRKVGQPTYYFVNAPGAKGFNEELEGCKAGVVTKAGAGRAAPRSVNDLVSRYYASADFNNGSSTDQHRRRLLIESFRAEFGDDLVANFSFEHIEAILLKRSIKRVNDRGRLVGGKAASQELSKQLRRLFAYAKRLQWIASNPGRRCGQDQGSQDGRLPHME